MKDRFGFQGTCAGPLGALVTLAFLAQGPAFAQTVSWLDQAAPVGWNTAGRAVPTATIDPNTPVDPLCVAQYRSPSKSRADRAVVTAGWSLVGPLQVFGDTELVTAASRADGMCRPLGYQAFVFSGGKFVGTLSPEPMASRTDGMANTIRLVAPDRLYVEYARYTERDALCCPSATTVVTFAIQGTGKSAVVEPVDTRTQANAPPPGAVAASAVLRGTAAYRERVELPADAVFEATLEDISIADRPAEVVGSARVQPAGQAPIRFEIPYDPARIVQGHRYAVRARITRDEKLLFTTTKIHPAFTGEPGAEMTLELQGTGRPMQESDRPLANTYWKLVRLGDREVTVAEGRREPHLVLRTDGRSLGGSGGCNSLNGSYKLDGAALTFGPVATTKMMCADTMEQEQAFLQALGGVRGWRVEGDRLEMLDGAGAVVARFLAVDLE